jgi:hypothetical protein
VVILRKLDDHLHNHPEGAGSDRTEKLPKKPSDPLQKWEDSKIVFTILFITFVIIPAIAYLIWYLLTS